MENDAISTYIKNCEPFAQPVLAHLRTIIHEVIPDIEEQIKWKMPSFEVEGKIVCSIAGFKKHCVLRFFKGVKMNDPENILLQIGKTEMSHIGNFNAIDQLPNITVLKKYIKLAKEATIS